VEIIAVSPKKESLPGAIHERLGVEVTTRCNIDCAHCFARGGTSSVSTLSIADVREIIAEGYRAGYRHLHITGGEPLLWDGLLEALDYAFAIGYKTVFLNTNGTLLSQGVCRSLAAFAGLSISVSLDGTKTLHERFRGNNTHGKTLQGIENALGEAIDLSIFTTACRSVLADLPRFANDLFERFPAISYLTLIQLIAVKRDGFPWTNELLGPNDFLRLLHMVSVLNLLGHRTRFLNNPLSYVASKLLKIYWIPHSAPLYSGGSMIVMANLDIRLSHSGKDSFGKYKSGNLRRVLDSDKYRNAVSPDKDICPLCKHSSFCREHGMDRPFDLYSQIRYGTIYCQKVMDMAAQSA